MILSYTIVSILAGSNVLVAIVLAVANRQKRGADTASELARNALAQVDSLQQRNDKMEKRQDEVEDEVRRFRASLFPHQGWDLKAHKEALKSDPDFPPPPELVI